MAVLRSGLTWIVNLLRWAAEEWEGAATRQRVVVFAVTIIIVSGVVLTIAGSRLNYKVDKINNGTTTAAIEAKQNQAELRFLLCSRNLQIISADRRADVEAVCEGYTSLEDAYASRGVPDPRSEED